MKHKTVLLQDAVASLQLSQSDIVVDATFGSGGHAAEILNTLGPDGTYIGVDVDETAFAHVDLSKHEATIHLVNDNFKNIKNILSSLHINSANAVLADLGWRMDQFDGSGKGFSFSKNEPLYMTYGDPKDYPFTAMDIVNDWDETSIADVLFGYGEERMARRIAKAIVELRKEDRITTSGQLADLVKYTLPKSAQFKRTHPATRTFQALRIAVNDELRVLEEFIGHSVEVLSSGGRLSIITFHSIEDRIVKHTFKDLVAKGVGTLPYKKPIAPSAEELAQNPRSRSAKLRTIIKT